MRERRLEPARSGRRSSAAANAITMPMPTAISVSSMCSTSARREQRSPKLCDEPVPSRSCSFCAHARCRPPPPKSGMTGPACGERSRSTARVAALAGPRRLGARSSVTTAGRTLQVSSRRRPARRTATPVPSPSASISDSASRSAACRAVGAAGARRRAVGAGRARGRRSVRSARRLSPRSAPDEARDELVGRARPGSPRACRTGRACRPRAGSRCGRPS